MAQKVVGRKLVWFQARPRAKRVNPFVDFPCCMKIVKGLNSPFFRCRDAVLERERALEILDLLFRLTEIQVGGGQEFPSLCIIGIELRCPLQRRYSLHGLLI